MKMAECGGMDEIFTHVDEETGAVLHINASAMMRDSKRQLASGAATVIEAYMDHEYIEFVKKNRGVEQWKLNRLEEPYLSMPCIGVWMRDRSLLTVDGHHRLVRWADSGRDTYLIVVFQLGVLPLYLVDDFPEDFSQYLAGEVKDQTPISGDMAARQIAVESLNRSIPIVKPDEGDKA